MRFRSLVLALVAGLATAISIPVLAGAQLPTLPIGTSDLPVPVPIPGATTPTGTTQTTTTQTTTTATTTTQTQTTQTQPPPPSDQRPPIFLLRPVKGQTIPGALAGGLKATVSCDEPCNFVVYGVFGEGESAKLLGAGAGRANANEPTPVTVTLNEEGKRIIAAAKQIRLSYVGAGRDDAQNTTSLVTSVGQLITPAVKKKKVVCKTKAQKRTKACKALAKKKSAS